jgi:hypothetical protein
MTTIRISNPMRPGILLKGFLTNLRPQHALQED